MKADGHRADAAQRWGFVAIAQLCRRRGNFLPSVSEKLEMAQPLGALCCSTSMITSRVLPNPIWSHKKPPHVPPAYCPSKSAYIILSYHPLTNYCPLEAAIRRPVLNRWLLFPKLCGRLLMLLQHAYSDFQGHQVAFFKSCNGQFQAAAEGSVPVGAATKVVETWCGSRRCT